jgi:hypothetical protein
LPVTVNFTNGAAWTEPENSGLSNTFGIGFAPIVIVGSEVSPSNFPGVVPVADGMPVQIGTNSNGVPIIATFHDNAAAVEAPDTGSTLGLLFLALMGLFGASRLRSLRLA